MPYARKSRRSFKRRPLRVTVNKSAKSKAVEALRVKNVKKIVKRVLKTNEETKCAVLEVFNQNLVPGAGLNYASGLGLFTSGAGGYPSSIVPLISPGTGDADRVGSTIQPKGLYLKFLLRAQNTTGNTTGTNPFRGVPMYVRVIIYNRKYATDDFDATNILDKGNTTGNIGSSPDAFLEPYNRRDFNIWYSRTFKMCALADTGSTPPSIENVPNGFQYMVQGRAKIKVPKQLYYSGTSTSPTNYSPKMAICMCNLDGTVVSNLQYRVMVNSECKLYYTDA